MGETSAWLIGRGGQELIEDSSYGKRLVRYGDLAERGWGIPLIILFAATPLPGDRFAKSALFLRLFPCVLQTLFPAFFNLRRFKHKKMRKNTDKTINY
ncbi:MAG: hypothetical protein ACUVXA_07105 [Candidatus Jordarchaeum sp.]|uniref:hypothetical protein n=1 Tax=Candidatus Jordarchaeum sp. TaxID=2823881 RepID=UPI00404926D0